MEYMQAPHTVPTIAAPSVWPRHADTAARAVDRAATQPGFWPVQYLVLGPPPRAIARC